MSKSPPENPVQSRNFERLARGLFPDGDERARFTEAVRAGDADRPAVIWTGDRTGFDAVAPLPWQPSFVDTLPRDAHPGRDSRHELGEYYCLDLSSVTCASVLAAISTPITTILDLCAAPGGKSVFAWRMFGPEFLVCNEVIRKRTAQLLANLRRCRIRAAVTSLDVSIFSRDAARTADLVIVDAPCSGQSLVARAKRAPACFHPATINQNANRQRRIIANAGSCVAENGYLAYMTCTYSREENENVLEWYLKRHPTFHAVAVPELEPLRSGFSEHPCYRIFPQRGFGAGGFTCLLRRGPDDPESDESGAESGDLLRVAAAGVRT